MNTKSIKWNLTNVLVAGRRVNGEAWGKDPVEAVRHLAARTARELKADVATAIATATADKLYKAEVAPREEVHG